MTSLAALNPRQLATQTLNFLLVLSTAFMLWKSLSVFSDSKSPIVVVLSGSMEPAFQRGDLLFLWNRDGLFPDSPKDYFYPTTFEREALGMGKGLQKGSKSGKVSTNTGKDLSALQGKNADIGDIVVYEITGKDIPIVHRVIRLFPHRPSRNSPLLTQLLTKGDNNAADDTELYARGQKYLDRDGDVVGKVVGYVPFVGYGTILLSEYPWLKSVMLGLMGVTVVLQRE